MCNGLVRPVVVNLWHACHSGLFVIIEITKMFAITGLGQVPDLVYSFSHSLIQVGPEQTLERPCQSGPQMIIAGMREVRWQLSVLDTAGEAARGKAVRGGVLKPAR